MPLNNIIHAKIDRYHIFSKSFQARMFKIPVLALSVIYEAASDFTIDHYTPRVRHKAQYTPPMLTRRNCRVASRRRCEHTHRQSWPSLQFPVLTTDDIMTSLLKKIVKIHEYYTTQQIRMFTNMQRHMLRHIVLLCHWLQNCKLGHSRRLRCAFASPNPSAVIANSCTHRRRDKTVSSRRRCVLGLT